MEDTSEFSADAKLTEPLYEPIAEYMGEERKRIVLLENKKQLPLKLAWSTNVTLHAKQV